MSTLTYTIDPTDSIQEQVLTQQFFEDLKGLVEDGLIEMEVDDNGEPRFYSTSGA